MAPQDILDRFGHTHYLVRTRFLRLFGGAYTIHDESGEIVLFSEMKRWRMREDIRMYDDENMARELLRINTRSVFDIAGAYDVVDSIGGERLGTLRRSGLSSTFMRDHWTVLDPNGHAIGEIREDSLLKALTRRFVDLLAFVLPQMYHVTIGGHTVATIQQHFNPLIFKLDVDFSPDTSQRLDRRLGMAAAVLLSAVEGRE